MSPHFKQTEQCLASEIIDELGDPLPMDALHNLNDYSMTPDGAD